MAALSPSWAKRSPENLALEKSLRGLDTFGRISTPFHNFERTLILEYIL